MNKHNSIFKFPSNYWVVLIPWMFPGWPNEFEVLIREYSIRSYQIIDWSYNKPDYYRNNQFCLNTYCEKITQQIHEVKKHFDKVINISLSYWGLISFILNEKLPVDWSLYISPICTNKWMNPKHEKRFVESLLWDEIKCLPIWINFFKMYGYNESFFYYISEFLKMRLSLIMNFDIHGFIKKWINFKHPTVIYFAEKEKDFLDWEKNEKQESEIEKIIHEMLSLLSINSDIESRKNHVWLNFDKNINFMPLKNATWNYNIITSISNPRLFLTHCEFTKHLNPYTCVLKHLVDSIENKDNLSSNHQYSIEKVLWKYLFQILSMQNQICTDIELLEMTNNIIRIDKKDYFSQTDVIASFKEYWDTLNKDSKKYYKDLFHQKISTKTNILSPTLKTLVSIINNKDS